MPHDHGHGHGLFGTNRPFEGRGSRVYNGVARWLMGGLYRRIAEDVAAAAPHEGRVLDIGTGPGLLMARIARLRPDLRVTGVDPSPDMVALAEDNTRLFGARVTAQTAGVTELPFADGSFDLVVSSFSLHHWDDPRAAVPELSRVLRPGGHTFVYDFRHAPFTLLASAARDTGHLTAQPPRHTPIRTGSPLISWCVRQVMTRE